MSGHGHVIPNQDGSKARCGGPALCPQCAMEMSIVESEYKDSFEKKLLSPDLLLKQMDGMNLSQKLRNIEHHFIIEALIKSKWNVSHASMLLGIHRGNILNRMKKLKIKTPKQLAKEISNAATNV